MQSYHHIKIGLPEEISDVFLLGFWILRKMIFQCRYRRITVHENYLKLFQMNAD